MHFQQIVMQLANLRSQFHTRPAFQPLKTAGTGVRPSPFLRHGRLSRCPSPVAIAVAVVTVRAESSGGLGDFFKKDSSKQDAARKALQDAFSGKKDPFAADEERRKKQQGGGGGGSGGGRGGSGGGGFNFDEFSDGFKRWLRSTFRALAATVLFAAAICAFYLWKPLLDFITRVFRFVLRLDGANPRAQMSAAQVATPDFTKSDRLGNVEESVIAKWGADGDDEGSEEEYTDEDGDEE